MNNNAPIWIPSLNSQIEIMTEYANGKRIQFYDEAFAKWTDIKIPTWNWQELIYRVAPNNKQLINSLLIGNNLVYTTIHFEKKCYDDHDKIHIKRNILDQLLEKLHDGEKLQFMIVGLSEKSNAIISQCISDASKNYND